MNRDDLENLLTELSPANGDMKRGGIRLSTRAAAAVSECFIHNKQGPSVEQLRAVMLHWQETGEFPL